MSITLCKRCVKLNYKIGSFFNYNLKLLNSSHNSHFALFLRQFSSDISGSENSNDSKTLNLTYEKVSDPDFSDGFYDEDEAFYPEPFDELQNISLNKLISFRNALNSQSDEFDYKSQINNLKLPKLRKQIDKILVEPDVNIKTDEDVVKVSLSESDLKMRSDRITEFLEKILREKVNRKCSVSFFGSAINGLWTDGSDLDVCVQIPNVTSRNAIIRNLRRISSVLTPLSPSRIFQNRFTAKIPILHWKRDCIKAPNKLINTISQGNTIMFI